MRGKERRFLFNFFFLSFLLVVVVIVGYSEKVNNLERRGDINFIILIGWLIFWFIYFVFFVYCWIYMLVW